MSSRILEIVYKLRDKFTAKSKNIDIALGKTAQTSTRSSRRITANNSAIASSYGLLRRAVKNAYNSVIGFFTFRAGAGLIKDILQTADSFLQVQARVKLATGGVKDYLSANASLFKIAQITRTEFGAVADLFSKVNKDVIALGGSQANTLAFVEVIGKASKVSGAGAQESAAAIRQLIQGLQSGVLRGDEFNSVMEQTPRIAQAIADGLGVTRGELRGLAGDGKLTAEAVINAVISQREVIDREFASVPKTISDTIQQIQNIWEKGIGELNQSADFTGAINDQLDSVKQKIVEFFAFLKKNPDQVAGFFNGLIGSVRLFANAFIAAFNGIQALSRIFSRAMFTFAADINSALAAITFGGTSREFAINAQAMRDTVAGLERGIDSDVESIKSAVSGIGAAFNPVDIKQQAEQSAAQAKPEIEWFMRADVQQAVASVNAARDQAQRQVKPVEVPIAFKVSGKSVGAQAADIAQEALRAGTRG